MVSHSLLPTLFRIAAVAATLALAVGARAEPQINEVMAMNTITLADEDGDFPDWIEIYNPDAAAVNLAGWYLTDNVDNKTKWQFPAVTLPAGGYLVVFASNKNRRDPTKPLHTNFALSSEGEYLGLVKPDGTTVVSQFAPTFPPQYDDISYGVAQTAPGEPRAVGYFRKATPGAANGGRSALMLIETVTMSRTAGPFTQTFNLTLTGASAGQHIRYALTPPVSSDDVPPEPTATSPLYTGPLSISSTVIVRAAVFSADDATSGRSTSAHFLKMDSSVTGFSSSLPIIVLDNNGRGELTKDNIDHPAWLYAYDAANTPFANQPAIATPATMTLRGNFSANFLKSSYSLTLDDNSLVTSKSQALLGLDVHAEWALIDPWLTDRSYIRNAFVYTLSNRIGRWAPRTKFVELFVNQNGNGLESSDYYGIGVLVDRIKVSKDRVDIATLAPDDDGPHSITGGYVVKLDVVPDTDHYNFITARGIPTVQNTAVVVDTPTAAKLTQKQRDYIRGYVQDMENALFASQATGFASRTYLDYIDVPSWVDHHILELFVGNVDGLYRSEYFSKDRDGKMVAGPAWDFDGSMGNGDDRNAAVNTWNTMGPVDPWNYAWYAPLARDPEFMQAWVDRWQELRRVQFADQSLTSLADSLAAQVGSAAAARDAARWVDNQSRYPGGYLGEVGHLKDWITSRAAWIDSQFVAVPAVASAGNSLTFTAPAGVQLVYTLDGSDPRALGGAIAVNATTTSSPLTVSATANVHVRGYRADRVGVFPGTPWSSATGGGSSSPLTPAPRIVNLASRAVAGSGDDTLIAGVTVADTLNKGYLARAVGPTLASFGVANTVPDPVLRVVSSAGVELFRNTGWSTSPDADKIATTARNVGAFPLAAGSADSALLPSLAAGGYTLQMSSASGKSGVGLIEFYASDDNGRTLNLSTRARVRVGEGVLTGGIVVRGPAYKRILVRAVGPTLSAFGLSGLLADPVVKVYDSRSTVVATNDDWSSGNASVTAAAAASVGAFALPSGSKDAAMLVTLAPGAYTVEISGKNNTEGIALLEIYEVP